jgi:hypothetical protein
VGGGNQNQIGTNSPNSTVAGGFANVVLPNASGSAIGGGFNNTATGTRAIIPGGILNTATNAAFAAGTRAKANHSGAFVWADSTSADFASTTNDQFNVRANGGARFVTSGAGVTVDGVPVFTGANGASLTNLNAANLTGTISSNNIAVGSITSTMLANGAVTTDALADGAVTALKVAMATNWPLSTTFTNPTPASGENFGFAVAAMGSDRVLIGAYLDDTGAADAGAAYLFSTTGTLLTTFTNPTPAAFDNFGYAVAAVGTDRVLIGAYQDSTGAAGAGAAYLFSTTGTLLTTFTNPTPVNGDFFGFAVAAAGSDRVLIGAYQDDTGTNNAGAAYLFSTNGTLLTTFTNPTPAGSDSFGYAVAAVGTDRVLIGARQDDTGAFDAGAAYLFSTNGTLLTTFTNPTPAGGDQFGFAVAAVGSDRVLISAAADDTGALDAGAAYLFSNSGTLLTTFTNPTPVNFDNFGIAVAALGTDHVFIGAPGDDTGATDAGAAYLFSTNGTLLTTFTNPTPAGSDSFGYPVAAVGTDRVLIGARQDDTGALDAGAAYLLSLESYTPGLVAEGVRSGAITSQQLADGAVGTAQIAAGTAFNGSFTGNGVGLTNLNAAQLTGGTVADARLSTNVALLNTNASFAGDVTALGDVRGARLNIGANNTVTGTNASVAGGTNNSADANRSFIGGGAGNVISSGGVGSTIGGGQNNQVTTDGATIAGGMDNVAGGVTSFIGGGRYNTNFAAFATIPGGVFNAATNQSFAAGSRAKAIHSGTFVWASPEGTDFSSTTNNQFNVRANGGARFVTSGAGVTVDGVPVFTGANGANLTNLNAAQLTGGTVPLALLPGAVVTNGETGLNLSGTFSGDGAGVTNVGLGTLSSGGALTWGNFTLAATLGTSGTFSVTSADVNGDGKVDLINVVAPSSLAVWTNNGNGGFVLSSSPGVGSSPRAVTTADVNGDGKVDLISANYGGGTGNTLTVLTNNGSGGFALASSPSVGGVFTGPYSVTSADVNGDGKVDLISANYGGGGGGGNTLTVLTNNGSGGFATASSPIVGSGPISVTAADVNVDGKVDLISANEGPDTLSVLTNNGSGGFVLSSSPSVGLSPYAVTSADVNVDGKVDLISANAGANTLSVLTNNGSGGFAPASTNGVGSGPYAVTAADVNADGKVDLISANNFANTLTVLTNNGSGGFVSASSPGVGAGPQSVTAADVNGDGQADLISGNVSGNSLSVLFNTPTFIGQFTGNGSGLTSLTASNLTGTINSNNIAAGTIGSAQIADGTIVNADVNAAAAIAYSKLNLAGSIVNADISPSAAIADTKLATLATAGKVADTALSANVALLSANPQSFSGVNNFATTVKVGTRPLADGQTVNLRVVGNDGPSWKGGGAFGHSNAAVILGELAGVATLGGHNSNLTAWASLVINPVGGNVGIGTSTPATTLHVGGNATTAGFNIVSATTNAPTAGATLTATSGYVVLNPAAAVTLNATTAITAGTTAGQMLILRGSSDTFTVTINDNANTALGANRVLGANDILSLMWSGSAWVEISLANN